VVVVVDVKGMRVMIEKTGMPLEFVYDIKAIEKMRVVLVNFNETGMKKMWEMMASPSLGHVITKLSFSDIF
jgi:uncharacterized protein related to proFAR isomerase